MLLGDNKKIRDRNSLTNHITKSVALGDMVSMAILTLQTNGELYVMKAKWWTTSCDWFQPIAMQCYSAKWYTCCLVTIKKSDIGIALLTISPRAWPLVIWSVWLFWLYKPMDNFMWWKPNGGQLAVTDFNQLQCNATALNGIPSVKFDLKLY